MFGVVASPKAEKWANIEVSAMRLGAKPATITDLPDAARSEAVAEVGVVVPVYGFHTLKRFGTRAALEAWVETINAVIADPTQVGVIPGPLTLRAQARPGKDGRMYHHLIIEDDKAMDAPAQADEPDQAEPVQAVIAL